MVINFHWFEIEVAFRTSQRLPRNLKKRVLRIIQTEGALSAIKYHRNETGSTLAESKKYVDELRSLNHLNDVVLPNLKVKP